MRMRAPWKCRNKQNKLSFLLNSDSAEEGIPARLLREMQLTSSEKFKSVCDGLRGKCEPFYWIAVFFLLAFLIIVAGIN